MTSVSLLQLKPGDVLLITHPQHLTAERGASIREQVNEFFPGVRVLVLSGGVGVSAVRPAG